MIIILCKYCIENNINMKPLFYIDSKKLYEIEELECYSFKFVEVCN